MTKLSYTESIIKIRKERDEHMVDHPRNWLALVGLFWLEEGDNPFGKSEANKIVLPSLPLDRCGNLRLDNDSVFLTEAADCVTLNGHSAKLQKISCDMDETPDLLEAGSILMMVLKRREHTLLRTWDREASAVKEFKGLNYFPIDRAYCLPARFEAYNPPKTILIHDAIGGQHESSILGRVHFSINNTLCSLEVEDAGDEGLISFVDLTKTDSTYPGGRYITLPKPIEDQVTLDFNLASNWPCAYTSYATCPLPPQANHLPVRIEAGEKRYHD
jgi:uncharacterized protein